MLEDFVRKMTNLSLSLCIAGNLTIYFYINNSRFRGCDSM